MASNDNLLVAGAIASLKGEVKNVSLRVDSVDDKVDNIASKLSELKQELNELSRTIDEYFYTQFLENRLGRAQTKIVEIRQKLEKEYGHYDEIRRLSVGLLQSLNLGLVNKNTIINISEEYMLKTPNYWLTACIVTLTSWLDNNREISEKALNESIKRDDLKSSLFFMLVNRRVGRLKSTLMWLRRYLYMQDPKDLDDKVLLVLQAFTSGLLGIDTENYVEEIMDNWLAELEDDPKFISSQISKWEKLLENKKNSIDINEYSYLSKYSNEWNSIKSTLQGAHLHYKLLEYLEDIFSKIDDKESINNQLDKILSDLVNNYDEEEKPLRLEEEFESLVIKFKGDEKKAKSSHNKNVVEDLQPKSLGDILNIISFDDNNKNYTLRKYSIALSKEYLVRAYRNLVLKNSIDVPNDVSFSIYDFEFTSYNGYNETDILTNFIMHFESKLQLELAEIEKEKEKNHTNCLIWIFGLIGALFYFFHISVLSIFLAFIIGCVGIFIYSSITDAFMEKRNKKFDEFNEKKNTGSSVIKSCLAELVEYRRIFFEKNSESSLVEEFIWNLDSNNFKLNPENNKKIIL